MGDERQLPGSSAVVVTPAHWKANHLLGGALPHATVPKVPAVED